MELLNDKIHLDSKFYEDMFIYINPDHEKQAQKDGAVTHPALIREIHNMPARSVTTMISENASLAFDIAASLNHVDNVTHLTLRGPFERASKSAIIHASAQNRDGARKVSLETRLDTFSKASQDIVVMNLVLDTLKKYGDSDSIHNSLKIAADLMKKPGDISCGGHLLIMRRDNDGQDLDDSTLKNALNKVGLEMSRTRSITDSAPNQESGSPSGYKMNICRFSKP